MRGVDTSQFRIRVKGRPALIRRLSGLLLAVHRFGRCRARTRADILWTAKLIDDLTGALTNARRADITTTDEATR